MSSASDSEEAPEEQAREIPTEEAPSVGAAPARVIPEPTPPGIVLRPRADGSGTEPHLASVEDADALAHAWNYEDAEEVRGDAFVVASDDEFTDDCGHGGIFLQLTLVTE